MICKDSNESCGTGIERGRRMQEREFNLLEEPWVKVVTASLEQKEVSLTDALVYAHEYMGLSGEMPTQDAALLRVLLAIGITIFYRYDADGRQDELSEENDSDEADIMERWIAYWEKGSFPSQAVKDYLEVYRERFWLFHPETPFWQVDSLPYGTDYDAKCMLGNIKESMNKMTRHHFSMAEGEALDRLGYGEAARWLIHLNAYGVNVKADKKAPGTTLPVGTGRMGQLGFVMATGENLFRILMLNLCPLNPDHEPWGTPRPVWAQNVCKEQSRLIPPPDNLPELYTMQSRRILLKRDECGHVTGFSAIGGDFYPVENDFNEPMTLWQESKSEKAEPSISFPKLRNPSVHAWREFPALFDGGVEGSHIPGVVQWMRKLCDEKLVDSLLTFRMIGMVYGDKMKYTYGDCVDDALALSAGLLKELGRAWIKRISEETDKCQAVSAALDHFSGKVSKLLYGNGSEKNKIKNILVSRYYFSVDVAFREWLSGICPEEEEKEEKLAQWEETSYGFARKTVEDYVGALDMGVCVYRYADKEVLAIPKILNEYLRELGKIYIRRSSCGEREQNGKKG